MDQTRRRRVPAMAPEDRRAALIAATIPLLHEHGPDVSTRQIAAAAGVAEGTIFGVFKDKNSLLVASLLQALDPQPTLDAIAAIDPELSLRERLTAATELVNQRFTGSAQLMVAARQLLFANGGDPEAAVRMGSARERLVEALTVVVEPSAGELRQSPLATARLLLLFCGANAHGPFGDPGHLDAGEMVSLLLDGLLIIPADDKPLVVPLFGKTDKC
jgi:AcrR family transcriptional regulator